jgi:hypothetical protein
MERAPDMPRRDCETNTSNNDDDDVIIFVVA